MHKIEFESSISGAGVYSNKGLVKIPMHFTECIKASIGGAIYIAELIQNVLLQQLGDCSIRVVR